MELADQILLAVLAATDAVFIPDRDPLARKHRVIAERRAQFPGYGVPWASEKILPGLDDLGRKQVQRALDRLAAHEFRADLPSEGGQNARRETER